ncbi:MAG: DUF3846 domain-containing protein [Prevotella sp.]|jgi:hypothetical protein|nr:DUF3846 domain-containing protein [Prevotella sp.]
MSNDLITVVRVKPGERVPEKIQIANTLDAFSKEVDGYIEAYLLADNSRLIICNEEGRIRNLKINRYISPLGPICGTFIVCGKDGDDLASLTEEQVKQTIRQFTKIEREYIPM